MTTKIIRENEARGPGGDVRALMQSPEETVAGLFETARAEGYHNGYSDGMTALATATAEAAHAVRGELFQLEGMIAPLVLQAVRKILGAMPPADVARMAIAEALREVAAGVSVTLRVAPDDVETARTAVAEMERRAPRLVGTIAAITGDAGLKPGEMLLETLKGRTHFGIDYQLIRLTAALKGIGA